ncbi:MAG: arginine N-succinyltransferase [Phycisphaerales bacterium]
MFLIRQSKPEDTPSLVKLARTVYFINLPPYENLIHAKIEHSQRCFRKLFSAAQPTAQLDADTSRTSRKKSSAKSNTKASSKAARSSDNTGARGGEGGMARLESESDMFMFSILDAESGSVVGTSQIRTRMGGPGNPNWRLAISEKKFHSESLRFGTTHTVARLDGDESGPCEIGGLILDPGFRGHKLRPGRLLSFIRFHLVGLYRQAFADTILAEMMGTVTSDGDNPFWDAFGRKFIPVKFAEADRFCQHNRKFIEELLPKDEIYLTLLPLEVINLVGVVGRETLPARRMLETLGFKYRGFVDPFDGGPHLDCATDKIPLVQWTKRATLGKATTPQRCTDQAIVSIMTSEGDVKATEAAVELVGEDTVRLLPATMHMLAAKNGQAVGVTPLKHFAREVQLEASAASVESKPPTKPKRSTKAK